MKDELIERIMFMLQRHRVSDTDIQSELIIILNDYEVTTRETTLAIRNDDKNEYLLKKFIITKTVKGCSDKTIKCYGKEITKILDAIGKSVDEITADDIRYYLALRERRDKVSRTTMDNELRYLRSFFGYLHSEELIQKNPTSKIDAVKGVKRKKAGFYRN